MARDLILIVHESQSFQHNLSLVLEAAGYDTLAASTGRAALGLFVRTNDDLAAVVMDVRIPGVDGVELATKMKALERTVPIVLMSDTIIDQVQRTYDAFLQIPFQDSALISTLEYCCQPARTGT